MLAADILRETWLFRNRVFGAFETTGDDRDGIRHSFSRNCYQLQSQDLERRALGLGMLSAVGLALLAGLGIGYGVARNETPNAEPVVVVEPESKFVINRVGELAGRLYRLESEAVQLAKRIGALKDFEKRGKAPAANPMQPPRRRRLRVANDPAGGGGLARPHLMADSVDDSLSTLESDLQRLEQTLTSIDQIALQRNLSYMAFPSREPVSNSRIGSRFGNRSDPFNRRLAFHSGLDFPAPSGTPIRASAGGRVVFAGWRSDYGNQVQIDHGNGLLTLFPRLQARGERWRYRHSGQVVAEVGSTGRSTGPHLHFEVLKDGEFVDPEAYLKIAQS